MEIVMILSYFFPLQMELMKKCEFARDKISSVLGLQLSCNETIDLGLPLSPATPTPVASAIEDVLQPSGLDDSIKKEQ